MRKIHSKKTREKISKTLMGHPVSKEAREKISKASKGRKYPKERGQRHSKMMKSFYKTPAGYLHRIKMSKFNRGANSATWKGGRIINAEGYAYVKNLEHPLANNKGYIAEHRLMAEKALGRFLGPKEMVHHINFKRDDNRNNNFLICTKEYNTWLHAKIKRMQLAKYFENLK